MNDHLEKKLRPIRSYVRREARMSNLQKNALETLWPTYGLNIDDGMVNPHDVFTGQGKLVLEIGFGMGASLLTMVKENPDHCFIGIEVHRPGVGKFLNELEIQQIQNVRVYCHDAVEVLKDCIPNASLDTVQIFFPDPWHKKRHHKRRLIQPDFVSLIASKLKVSGMFHLATDWQNYAEYMLEVIEENSDLKNQAGPGQYHLKPDTRPQTKFETRGQLLGHEVFDLVFQKI